MAVRRLEACVAEASEAIAVEATKDRGWQVKDRRNKKEEIRRSDQSVSRTVTSRSMRVIIRIRLPSSNLSPLLNRAGRTIKRTRSLDQASAVVWNKMTQMQGCRIHLGRITRQARLLIRMLIKRMMASLPECRAQEISRASSQQGRRARLRNLGNKPSKRMKGVLENEVQTRTHSHRLRRVRLVRRTARTRVSASVLAVLRVYSRILLGMSKHYKTLKPLANKVKMLWWCHLQVMWREVRINLKVIRHKKMQGIMINQLRKRVARRKSKRKKIRKMTFLSRQMNNRLMVKTELKLA